MARSGHDAVSPGSGDVTTMARRQVLPVGRRLRLLQHDPSPPSAVDGLAVDAEADAGHGRELEGGVHDLRHAHLHGQRAAAVVEGAREVDREQVRRRRWRRRAARCPRGSRRCGRRRRPSARPRRASRVLARRRARRRRSSAAPARPSRCARGRPPPASRSRPPRVSAGRALAEPSPGGVRGVDGLGGAARPWSGSGLGRRGRRLGGGRRLGRGGVADGWRGRAGAGGLARVAVVVVRAAGRERHQQRRAAAGSAQAPHAAVPRSSTSPITRWAASSTARFVTSITGHASRRCTAAASSSSS